MVNNESEFNYFNIDSGKIAASGNIMFLMDKTGELKDLSGKDYCCAYMFQSCTSLTQAPELPATTLTESCYNSMFAGCTYLRQAPELPATTLADYCYTYMFAGCASLTQAPALPATTLADYCYNSMFEACKSPFTFPDKTFDEVANLIQEQNLIGGDGWYDENWNLINPVEIICSDKTMLVTYDENEGFWTITEK
jgi:hypothetical protein